MNHGLTKAWRSKDGGRRFTFREGGNGPLTFTIMVTKDWRPEFFYISIVAFGRWFRWHRNWRRP